MYVIQDEEEKAAVKGWVYWLIGVVLVLSVVGWCATRVAKPAESIIDNAIPNYEDFQEMYNACQKLNSDLATVRAVPDSDPMFSAFSKAQVVAAKRQQMTRWVEEYNAKSKMWNRALWKSKTLPYQLATSDFSNYER